MVFPVAVAMLVASPLDAHAYEAPMPTAASDADNACASAVAYALSHAEAELQPYIKSCGENANKRVCEITLDMLKTADAVNGRTYGLTCIGKP